MSGSSPCTGQRGLCQATAAPQGELVLSHDVATYTSRSSPSEAVQGIGLLGPLRLWFPHKEGITPRRDNTRRAARQQGSLRQPCLIHSLPSAVPDGVGQGEDPQHEEIHGKQKVDVLLREYLQDKSREGLVTAVFSPPTALHCFLLAAAVPVLQGEEKNSWNNPNSCPADGRWAGNSRVLTEQALGL